jgi:sterol desaturase/sphingolipid hydroxylase (fatty acid hydroxylase superfamily)
MNTLIHLWLALQNGLATQLIAPLVGFLHLTALTDSPQDIAGFLMVSAAQVAAIGLVFRPIERLVPLEHQTPSAIGIDRRYTLLKLLGLVPLFTYLILVPVSNLLGGAGEGAAPLQLDHLVPWFAQHPLAQFVAYFAVYDFTLYVVHRLQHAVPAWWMLHSLHHSQRQISCWSNDRDSFLDDVFEAVIIAAVSMIIGASPTEFAGLVLIGQLIENFSHANVRFGYGRVLDKLIVDPRFHRLHHMRDDPAYPNRHNCNFSLVFPIWDVLFGTALYNEPPHPCGVSVPVIDADNGKGLWAQQWWVLKRFGWMLARGELPSGARLPRD